MASQSQNTVEPKVFIGIPTGAPKLYSTYYMLAALANLDYKNVELHWAVTGVDEYPAYLDFHGRLTKLMGATKFPDTWSTHIHWVKLSKEEQRMQYKPILANKTVLRDSFLDSDAEYFLLLGGDNPPQRKAIKRLLEVDADVSMGTCYQRPGVDKSCGVYPLVWRFMWMPRELEGLKIDPRNKRELIEAWYMLPTLINICYDFNWKRKRQINEVVGGDGCALIKRKVLERIDWGLMPPMAYNSEDIHFMTTALYNGFTTACATDLHVPHLAEDGMMY